MASSTLRCGHARCDCCRSQKLLPAERTMSATSRVGRLIASSASWSALLHRVWIPRWLPADWEQPAGVGVTNADTPSYQRAWRVPEEPGWCAARLRAHTTSITHSVHGVMHRVRRRIDQPRNLLLIQDGRQAPLTLGKRNVIGKIGPTQRLDEEKTQRRGASFDGSGR